MSGAASSITPETGLSRGQDAATSPRRARLRAITLTRARRRTWIRLGAALAIGFGVAILVVASLAPALGFFTYQRGTVLGLEGGSAAAAAGVHAGDTIVSVNGVFTPTPYDQQRMLSRVRPGDSLALGLRRGQHRVSVRFDVGRKLPIGSAAGILLGLLLLGIAWVADPAGADPLPRVFFRSTIVYVIFLAGAFSLETAMSTSVLAVPWIFSMVLAAPLTCHHMMRFPAGSAVSSPRVLATLYVPPLLLGVVLSAKHVTFALGYASAMPESITIWGGTMAGGMAAVYLSVGAFTRGRRLRRKQNEIDPIAAKWLHLGGLSMAIPLVAATGWALHDTDTFLAGGFRPFVAAAMIGGSACVVLAMTRTPFGDLDRMWRRSTGYLVATSLAAGLYLACIGLLGGTASALSGGDFQAALAATLVAAVVFGPLRQRMQGLVDERFGRSRSRARGLLREASESAAATLDLDALCAGVAHRVRAALSSDGAAIFVTDHDARGVWTCVAQAGDVGITAPLLVTDEVSRTFDLALSTRSSRELPHSGSVLAVPLMLGEGGPAMLVVAPRDGRCLDGEARELLSTAAAGLVVAMSNARAHRRLEEAHAETRTLATRLAREVAVAKRGRQEIARLKDRLEEENQALISTLASRSGTAPVIGEGLRATFELVQKVARTDASVVIRGETGVGKELIARAIHAGSPRRDGPFIVVDCGAIAKGVFESSLFGHERGAFTGAIRATQGAFRSANGGTVFLDELGELPLELQPKLLRVLQQREVTPVGGARPVSIDVRVVAGTNRNLVAEVERGRFRSDLLYRLQVVEIEVPPLRQRAGDIPRLAETFLTVQAERAGRQRKRLTTDAMSALCEHDWPGNVRELENALEAAAVYASGDEIQPADLPVFDKVFRTKGKRALSDSGTHERGGAPRAGLRETLEGLEKERLREALRENDGNRTRTAKALGMSRGALLRRLKRYELQGVRAVA